MVDKYDDNDGDDETYDYKITMRQYRWHWW